MKRIRVKVCGITRPSDALLATELGADMIGLIFYRKSSRWVTQTQARRIIAELPPIVSRVGVYVDEDIDTILRRASKLHLDFIQLHGREPKSYITRLQREGLKVIRSFSVKKRSDYRDVVASRADLCLLDNSTDAKLGGTGSTFDWTLIPPRKIPNLVLAGGINADNVSKGVKLFGPLVVDVNSGVEMRPGEKSRAKLKRFFEKCDRMRYGQ